MNPELEQKIKDAVQRIRHELGGGHSLDWYGVTADIVLEREIRAIFDPSSSDTK